MSNQTIVEKPTIHIIGIQCRTVNTVDAAPIHISELWDKFYRKDIFSKIPNKNAPEIYALYCDYDGDHTDPYTLVIGCSVKSTNDVPKGMVHKEIPMGIYRHFPAIGEFPTSLVETWQSIWDNEDLKRTYTGDFEVYGEKFSNDPQQVDIYIAVES